MEEENELEAHNTGEGKSNFLDYENDCG